MEPDVQEASYPLEPSTDQVRAMLEAATDSVAEFLDSLPSAPAAGLEGGEELARRLRGPVPAQGAPFADLLPVIREAAAKGLDTTGPGYLAYIPGGGLVAAAVADLLANTLNRFTGMWHPTPAMVQMEWNVIRWLADVFGYPPEARGVLTSGGSMANLSALLTARKAHLPEDFLSGTLYVTDQTHASVAKVAMLAGFPARNVRAVPTTPALRMDPDALRASVKADRAAGSRPFCVIATAGTTNTGAVDPLERIGRVAREEDLWLHVDGAYGGFFQLTERGREKFRGIDVADSITLDPHKGMFLPYGTGCLLVRDGKALRQAHSVEEAGYLQDLATEGESLNFSDYSPELSRDFRGLRVWLPIKLHGLDAFRTALDEKLDLARLLFEALRELPALEVPWEPDLSIVAFRARAGDAASQQLLEEINASGRVFLSSTVIEESFLLRAAILSHRTHRDRIEEAVEIVRRAAERLPAVGT
jgi:aromatic-L-amino-acid decarboxylase